MESYALKFDATTGKRNLPASGNLFVYESASVAVNAETRIRVKPDNGGVIVLRPGQWFRNPDDVQTWALESYSGSDVIDAVFVIGYGEFGDANTLNKFTLDATLTNNVTITNTPAARVPVTMDLAQTIPVSIAGTVNVAGTTVNYTNAWSDSTTAAATGTVIFSPAANVNGAYIEYAQVAISNNQTVQAGVSLIAKNSVPGSFTDGDVVMNVVCAGVNNSAAVQFNHCNEQLGVRVKIPAGKGLYLAQGSGVPDRCLKTVLYTLL